MLGVICYAFLLYILVNTFLALTFLVYCVYLEYVRGQFGPGPVLQSVTTSRFAYLVVAFNVVLVIVVAVCSWGTQCESETVDEEKPLLS